MAFDGQVVAGYGARLHLANKGAKRTHCGREFIRAVTHTVRTSDVCRKCKDMYHPNTFKQPPFEGSDPEWEAKFSTGPKSEGT